MPRKDLYIDLDIAKRLDEIETMTSKGLVDKDIAHNLKVSLGTFYGWKKKYPEIDIALKRGKKVADQVVVSALYKRAMGYDYDEVTTGTNDKGTFTKTVKKHVVSDVVACIFWLKNRQPKDWRDKKDVAIEGDGKFTLIVHPSEVGIKPPKDKPLGGVRTLVGESKEGTESNDTEESIKDAEGS